MSRRDALERILAVLLGSTRSGVIQLDRRGRVVAASGHAGDLLLRGDGLSDQGGSLHARAPADDAALQALLARALPCCGGQGAGGSMTVRRTLDLPGLVLHVSPVDEGGTDMRAHRVAALVLVIDPTSRTRIDPALVAATLGLTPMESRVAVWLAEGKTVRDIAWASGKHDPLAHEEHLRQAGHRPAVRAGAAGAVVGVAGRSAAAAKLVGVRSPGLERGAGWAAGGRASVPWREERRAGLHLRRW